MQRIRELEERGHMAAETTEVHVKLSQVSPKMNLRDWRSHSLGWGWARWRLLLVSRIITPSSLVGVGWKKKKKKTDYICIHKSLIIFSVYLGGMVIISYLIKNVIHTKIVCQKKLLKWKEKILIWCHGLQKEWWIEGCIPFVKLFRFFILSKISLQ